MADYRLIWLTNSLGERFDLTKEESHKIFLSGIQGFGFAKKYEVMKAGDQELLSHVENNFPDITGELRFYETTNGFIYEDYQKLINFIKYTPLELHYQTPNNLEGYHCDIIFVQADKGEIDRDGTLHVPVIFHRLTEWLNDEDIRIHLSNKISSGGKIYPLTRPYNYAFTDLSGSSIWNNGTDEMGFLIQINGLVTNPQFTLTQNGELYGICRINGTFDYISIDSVTKNESIYLERNGVPYTNPEQYQDFSIRNGVSYLTWCKFKVGETIFAFTSGNIDSFDGEIIITFKNGFISV